MINTIIVSGTAFNVRNTEKGVGLNLSIYQRKNAEGKKIYSSHSVFIPAAVLNGHTIEEKDVLTIEGYIRPYNYTNRDGSVVYTETIYAKSVSKTAKSINMAIVEGSLYVKGTNEHETDGRKWETGYGNLSVQTGKDENGKHIYGSIDVTLSPSVLFSLKNLHIEDGALVVATGSLFGYKSKDGSYKEGIAVTGTSQCFANKTEKSPGTEEDFLTVEDGDEDADGFPFA